MAQQFDEKQLELIGNARPVAQQVGSIFGVNGYFSSSSNGVLVYRSGFGELFRLSWFDRQGNPISSTDATGTGCLGMALSPKGDRAAVSWISSGPFISNDLWIIDFARKSSNRFTFGKGNSYDPIWSPDGTRIIFSAALRERSDLYQKQASGVKEEELLLESMENKYPSSWSSDSRFLLYTPENSKTKSDLWVLTLEGNRKSMPFLRTEFNEGNGRFSPDMRWVAYDSDESGTAEIYVRAFSPSSVGESPPASGQWLVSRGGGRVPLWRGDGKELYYRANNGAVMTVEINAGTEFRSGMPKVLFQVPARSLADRWDVDPSGNRFLLVTPEKETALSPFTFVLNWTSLLNK